MRNLVKIIVALIFISSIGCNKDDESPNLIVKYTFDENQDRLDNFGNPAVVPAGNAAQTPDFNLLGVHSIELIPTQLSIPSESSIIFKGAETNAGGSTAIDFAAEKFVGDNEVLVSIPLNDITPGTYNYFRNSLAYQEYVIDLHYEDGTLGSFDIEASVASFIGFNNYITSHALNSQSFDVNGNKLQGYFAVNISNPIPYSVTGDAPATTVPNPLTNSPIPAGSCLVTGSIETPLIITGNETEDIVINVSISIKESFEWEEVNVDGLYEPAIGETVVDMGVRGLQVTVQQ